MNILQALDPHLQPPPADKAIPERHASQEWLVYSPQCLIVLHERSASRALWRVPSIVEAWHLYLRDHCADSMHVRG